MVLILAAAFAKFEFENLLHCCIEDSLWPKFNLSPDKKTLTISKVCKSCSEGTFGNSDLMVIQCNASNVHGYIYGNGYINVLGMLNSLILSDVITMVR